MGYSDNRILWDGLIIAKFQSGDESALKKIIDFYFDDACNYVSGYISNREIAKEVTMEGFMKVWRFRNRLSTPRGIKAYLYTALRHRSYRLTDEGNRYKKKINNYAYLEQAYSPDYLEANRDRDLFDYIFKIIDSSFSKQQIVVLTKLYKEGMSTREIAAELSLAYSSVNNTNANGIKKLRKLAPMFNDFF